MASDQWRTVASGQLPVASESEGRELAVRAGASRKTADRRQLGLVTAHVGGPPTMVHPGDRRRSRTLSQKARGQADLLAQVARRFREPGE